MRLFSYGALAIVNVRVFPSRFRWREQSDIDCLACFEYPAGRFLETEGHRALGNLLSACQL
jgi:hypothetical protein